MSNLLFSGLCSVSLVPFADTLDDDLCVDVTKNANGLAIKARTHNNLTATPAEYGLLNWLITRLPLIGVEPKDGDCYYIRQSIITPAITETCESTVEYTEAKETEVAETDNGVVDYAQ
jgi:hypothetical protein